MPMRLGLSPDTFLLVPRALCGVCAKLGSEKVRKPRFPALPESEKTGFADASIPLGVYG